MSNMTYAEMPAIVAAQQAAIQVQIAPLLHFSTETLVAALFARDDEIRMETSRLLEKIEERETRLQQLMSDEEDEPREMEDQWLDSYWEGRMGCEE